MENNVQDNIKRFICRDYHVLVVDDVALNRSVAGAMIGSYGIEVDEADGGRPAIAMAKEHKYDMIFMDHMMPEIDGVEAARSILEYFGESAEAPVMIALTANPAQDFRETYESNGICDVLSKPIEPIQLYNILDKWIPENRKQYVEQEQEEEAAIPDVDLIRLFMLDIDVVSAVRTQGSINAYLDLIDLFYTDGLRRKGMLKDLIDRQDISNYVIEVHGLKSAAANIGAGRLSDLAKKHEESGKASSFTYIKENAELLFDAYERVLQEIARVLDQHQYGQFSTQQSGGLAQIGEKDMLGRLEKILKLLGAFQSKEAAQGVDELLGCAVPEVVREKLKQVKVMLKMYEDDEAEETLRDLIQSTKNL